MYPKRIKPAEIDVLRLTILRMGFDLWITSSFVSIQLKNKGWITSSERLRYSLNELVAGGLLIRKKLDGKSYAYKASDAGRQLLNSIACVVVQ